MDVFYSTYKYGIFNLSLISNFTIVFPNIILKGPKIIFYFSSVILTAAS